MLSFDSSDTAFIDSFTIIIIIYLIDFGFTPYQRSVLLDALS